MRVWIWRIGSVSGDRFSGIDGSLKVAGVDGVEIGVRQSLCDRFRLESSGCCERHVEVALGFVVQVALCFTVTDQCDRARRGVEDMRVRAQFRFN